MTTPSKTKRRRYLLTAYQKVLQDLEPRCTITTDGDKLGMMSTDEDQGLVLHNMPRFVLDTHFQGFSFMPKSLNEYRLYREDVAKLKYPTLKYPGISQICPWKIEKLEISLSSAKQQIRPYGITYYKLRILTDFKGTNGLNETQLLKRYNNLVYVDNVWPCEESTVKALGLVGEVKNIRIQ